MDKNTEIALQQMLQKMSQGQVTQNPFILLVNQYSECFSAIWSNQGKIPSDTLMRMTAVLDHKFFEALYRM